MEERTRDSCVAKPTFIETASQPLPVFSLSHHSQESRTEANERPGDWAINTKEISNRSGDVLYIHMKDPLLHLNVYSPKKQDSQNDFEPHFTVSEELTSADHEQYM